MARSWGQRQDGPCGWLGRFMGNIWEKYGKYMGKMVIYGKYMGMECYSPISIVVQVTWLVVGRK